MSSFMPMRGKKEGQQLYGSYLDQQNGVPGLMDLAAQERRIDNGDIPDPDAYYFMDYDGNNNKRAGFMPMRGKKDSDNKRTAFHAVRGKKENMYMSGPGRLIR